MLWLRAKQSKTDPIPQMQRKFPLPVSIWSTLSEGLLRLYCWSQSWSVPSSLSTWKPDGVESEEVIGWEPGPHDWAGAGWPDLCYLATLSPTLGRNFWDLQALPKPQDYSWAPERFVVKELSVPQPGRCGKECHEKTCLGTFWEMEITIWREWPLFHKMFNLKSPLNRLLLLVAHQGSKQIFLRAFLFQIYWGAGVTHPTFTYKHLDSPGWCKVTCLHKHFQNGEIILGQQGILKMVGKG